MFPGPHTLQPGLQVPHSHALPEVDSSVLATSRAPPHLYSMWALLPLSLCLIASASWNSSPLLLVNCDSTLKASSNVNSEISQFLGISYLYPQAELSPSLLCMPRTLVLTCTWHFAYEKIYMVSLVPFVLYFPASVHSPPFTSEFSACRPTHPQPFHIPGPET